MQRDRHIARHLPKGSGLYPWGAWEHGKISSRDDRGRLKGCYQNAEWISHHTSNWSPRPTKPASKYPFK